VSGLTDRARRAAEICNACRYCEGFCAVYPAITRRRAFSSQDLDYLANLCHGCGNCFHSCQYAPPHPFAINMPQLFAELRVASYERYAWPRPLGRLFGHRHAGPAATLLVVALTTLFLLLSLRRGVFEPPPAGAGSFYSYLPHVLMASIVGVPALFALCAVSIGAATFWNRIKGDNKISARAVLEACRDVLTLRNLGGQTAGCNDRDERFSVRRRRFHHCVFYGFLLCFAATLAATFYHYVLGLEAPYAWTSVPVQLGTWGGVAMVVGLLGLAQVRVFADPRLQGATQGRTLDWPFVILLLAISLTGLLLLALRNSEWTGALLVAHLALVVGFLLLLPYGKMVHGIYRALALLLCAIEGRRTRTEK
jgi:citrate/tricarballylate utilization protein